MLLFILIRQHRDRKIKKIQYRVFEKYKQEVNEYIIEIGRQEERLGRMKSGKSTFLPPSHKEDMA